MLNYLTKTNSHAHVQYCLNYNLKLKKKEEVIVNISDCEDGITLCKSKKHKKAMKKTSWFNLNRKVCLVSQLLLVLYVSS